MMMKMKVSTWSVLVISLFVLTNCSKNQQDTSDENPLFIPVAAEKSGVNFVNAVQDSKALNILDYLYFYNGGGVAAGDVNNDGLTDLFFVSNQGKNRLYLNKTKKETGIQLEDVSEKARIGGSANWKTGVTMADINGDGWLDIYVCAVSNYKSFKGHNELFINNQDGTFSERSKEYGLDFQGFSTQAAFFDYDHDGDLDMYLLNHAVHTSISYDRVNVRALERDELAGDYFFRNDGSKFTDVSAKAGIYAAPQGYGLGISIGDLNNDGWEDIYVANDFHEDDYYYINQKNGTFKEAMREHFMHTSKFSMGNDMADVNNDGLLDIVTMDMYPQDPKVEKSSMGEDPLDIYLYKLQFGYYNQYTRNTLQLNLGGERFSDIGAMAGISATDWSWSPLLADYDNDGIKDLFITNGIERRPNDLEYIKYVSNPMIEMMLDKGKKSDDEALSKMPAGRWHNYLYKGTDSLLFEDKSLAWGFKDINCSNGAAYADLDNDGDLELITNNLNSPAGIYENKANELFQNRFLKVKLQGKPGNGFGIGAKVYLKVNNKWLYQQNIPTRGFMSSVEPALTFGLGKNEKIDSLIVVWPSQKAQIFSHIVSNQTLTLRQEAAVESWQFSVQKNPLFEDISAQIPIAYTHRENEYYDFTREPLMPFKISTEGPKIAVGDVNGDRLEDFYVGGAKYQAGKLFLQKPNGQFNESQQAAFLSDTLCEDIDATFFDADGDKDLDLYVVSGGNEFFGKDEPLLDRLYLNDGQGNFVRNRAALPVAYGNKSCVKPFDFDQDGDLDLFVGGRVVAYHYGEAPETYLLINNGKGVFADQTSQWAPELRKAGMITDAVWADIDNDKDADLVVVGDWMGITIFENKDHKLNIRPSVLDTQKGFWQTIKAADLDGDGDIDFVAGNLGENTKFRRSQNAVLRMYTNDFLNTRLKFDQILAYSEGEEFYPVAAKDELGKTLPFLNKRFPNYKDFAGKTIEKIFKSAELDAAQLHEVNTFESVWLENTGKGDFIVHRLPSEAQVSKVFAIHIADVTNDGKPDILLGGNYYNVSTYQGRYDAGYGLILQNNFSASGKTFKPLLPTSTGFLLTGEVRDIQTIRSGTQKRLLVSRNKDKLMVFKPKQ
ncbi:MAG: VCBS repeat-containing protein [Spirosomataceae bacterium]